MDWISSSYKPTDKSPWQINILCRSSRQVDRLWYIPCPYEKTLLNLLHRSNLVPHSVLAAKEDGGMLNLHHWLDPPRDSPLLESKLTLLTPPISVQYWPGWTPLGCAPNASAVFSTSTSRKLWQLGHSDDQTVSALTSLTCLRGSAPEVIPDTQGSPVQGRLSRLCVSKFRAGNYHSA